MTKKLYYINPYQKQVTANILKKEQTKEGYWILLDQTIFYPEGGGQPCDLGSINDADVLNVVERKDEIWHLISKNINSNTVECTLNWNRRFDHMQQHGGQHVMSGVAHKLYGAMTVGFHLSESYTTVDLKIPQLTKEQLLQIEKNVNEIIYENRAINCYIVDMDKVKTLDLRKKPIVTEDIRIVEIENFDRSPCCGTHPFRTGEIGIFKILKTEKIRGNVRLYIVSGKRALENYTYKNNIFNNLIELTSANEHNLFESIQKVYESEKAKNKEINILKEQLLSYEAINLINQAELINGKRIIKYISSDLSANELKKLHTILIKKAANYLILLASTKETPRIAIYYKNDKGLNVGKLFKEVLAKYNGKGGGNNISAQGGCNSITDAKQIIEELSKTLIE